MWDKLIHLHYAHDIAYWTGLNLQMGWFGGGGRTFSEEKLLKKWNPKICYVGYNCVLPFDNIFKYSNENVNDDS